MSLGQAALSEPSVPNYGDPSLVSPDPQPIIPTAPEPPNYDNWECHVIDARSGEWTPIDPFNGNYKIVGAPKYAKLPSEIRPAIAGDDELMLPGTFDEVVTFRTTVHYVIEGSYQE